MKVLVIGYGSMGRRRAATARALGHDVCLYDAEPPLDYFRRENRVALCETDGLAWGPDAVVIATPAATHADLLHRVATTLPTAAIFVEKPLALSADDFFRPWGDVVRFDRPVQVGYNMRYNAVVEEMRRKIADASMPPPLRAQFFVACDASTWPGRDYADTLLECSHEIDLALWFLGKATVERATRVEDLWTIDLKHASGATSTIAMTMRAHGRYERWGHFDWDDRDGYYVIDDPKAEPISREIIEDGYRREFAAFLDVAATDGRAPCSSTEGLDVLGVVDAARKLVYAGR